MSTKRDGVEDVDDSRGVGSTTLSGADAASSAKVGDHGDADASSAVARPTGKRGARRSRILTDQAVDTEAVGDGSLTSERALKASTHVSRNPFVRLWTFLRQVIAELRKVFWPSRSELVAYTIVVLIFVVVMVALIAGLDLGFGKLVLAIFGDGS